MNTWLNIGYLNEMADQAAAQLQSLGSESSMEKLKNQARKILGRNTSAGVGDPLFWPAGLLLLGLCEMGRYDECEEYLKPFLQNLLTPSYVDDALTGYVMLQLYKKTGKLMYLQGADKIVNFLLKAPEDEDGSLIYNPRNGSRSIFADGIGMSCLLLIEYGSAINYPTQMEQKLLRKAVSRQNAEVPKALRRRREALQLAARQIRAFAANGMDSASGLPYHGYNRQKNVCEGIIGWGRAVGWLLMGSVPDPAPVYKIDAGLQPVYESFYQTICRALPQYRREDGLFSWQLQATRSYADVSATGMIYWSLLKGAARRGAEGKDRIPEGAAGRGAEGKDRILESAAGSNTAEKDRILETAEKAAEGIKAYVKGGVVSGALAECLDFAMYRQEFGVYPWGQGAALAMLKALYDMS